jgi:hypothetical protein
VGSEQQAPQVALAEAALEAHLAHQQVKLFQDLAASPVLHQPSNLQDKGEKQ